MRRISFLLALLCLLIPAFAAQAQAPDAINTALSDLSKRVGHTVTINDLGNWSFEQNVYPNAGLGCPQPGVRYADVQTVGIQFTLTYNGTAYDYRVSGDKTIVVLCNSNTATEVPAPCPPPGDTAFLAPRLSIGIQGQVVIGGFPNNIRDLPGTSGKYLGEIPPGQNFTVLDGPRCSLIDKLVWWQVNYNNIIGWTAEGKDGEYWVTPLNLVGTPQAVPLKSPITTANAGQVAVVPGLTANGLVALSPNGDLLAQAAITNGQMMVQVFQIGSTNTAPGLPLEAVVTSLAFDPTSTLILIGLDQGTTLLAAITPSSLDVRLQMPGHTGAVNALAFSGDGKLIVSGGADGVVRLWDASSGANLAILQAHRNPVTSVAFSADGSTIISTDNQGTTYLWRVTSGAAG